jgi:hypothetical protein
MTSAIRLSAFSGFLAAVVWAVPATAQPRPSCGEATKTLAVAIDCHWPRIVVEVAGRKGVRIDGVEPKGTAVENAAVYREAFDRLAREPEILKALHPDVDINEQVTTADRVFVNQLAHAGLAGSQAKSLDSAATNPVAGARAERSGFTSLLGLATANNFINSDGTAVSIDLSALALYGLADPDVYSSLYIYRQHSALRRIGGTVIFGSKIPEKAITGISGLPDADTLFDAFSWDVKVRVLGDRDPRAAKWYPLTVSTGGNTSELSAALLSSSVVPVAASQALNDALKDWVGVKLADIKARIARSPQLTIKAAGLHLNADESKNKYSFGALFDVGFTATTALTANALYSTTNDARFGTGNLFQIKQLDLSAAVTTEFAKDVFAVNRAVSWKSGANSLTFTNKSALPAAVKADNTWKLFTEFSIPLGDAAQIPISVLYTNDGTALKKEKYVSGNVGISYDFSALGKLFTNKQN